VEHLLVQIIVHNKEYVIRDHAFVFQDKQVSIVTLMHLHAIIHAVLVRDLQITNVLLVLLILIESQLYQRETHVIVLMGIHKNKYSFILFTNFSLDFIRTMFKFALLVMSLALLAMDLLTLNV
jgi:hypothetical protein